MFESSDLLLFCQVYMAEKMRVVNRPEGEPNYHIFYQLLSGADDDLRSNLNLENLSEANLFMTPLQRVSFSIF